MITPQALEIIENYCRYNWAKAPKQSQADADYVQNVAIAAMSQVLTNPTLLKAQGLHTTEELNAARSEAWDAAVKSTECNSEVVDTGDIGFEPYVSLDTDKIQTDKETFLSSLPVSSEWVRVEDRLPEHDGSVLIAFSDGKIDHDWWDKEFNHWSTLRHDTRKITHWQPLPSPPTN